MRCAVILFDQQHSRRHPDRIPELVSTLPRVLGTALSTPERTAGDEAQVLYSHAHPCADALVTAIRCGGWHIGVGFGHCTTAEETSVRAAHGSAFLAARQAIDTAKGAGPTVLRATADSLDADIEPEPILTGLLCALQHIVSRRSEPGRQATTMAAGGLRGTQIAEQLGITAQAVSARLRAAHWDLEQILIDACRSQVGALLPACG